MFNHLNTLSFNSLSQLSGKYLELVTIARTYDNIYDFDAFIGYQPNWQDLITGECSTNRHYLSPTQLQEISAFCYMAWLEAHDIGRTILFD